MARLGSAGLGMAWFVARQGMAGQGMAWSVAKKSKEVEKWIKIKEQKL